MGNHSGRLGGQEIPKLDQPGFLERPMTRQNPGRSWAPGLPTHNSNPIFPCRTYLSYSDRVRNMARVGESGRDYARILRAYTSAPARNSPHRHRTEAPLPTARAPATPSARPPAPASYWLYIVPAEVIGPTSFPAWLWLVREGRDSGRISALNRRWLLGALETAGVLSRYSRGSVRVKRSES